MVEKAKSVEELEQAKQLLRQVVDEIRSLRQLAQFQGGQLEIVDKLSKISGWQSSPQGASPDVCRQIERFIAPSRPLGNVVEE